MSDFHCLEIEFPKVDFSKFGFLDQNAKIRKVHHAHLYTRENEIELQILFDDKTSFGDFFMNWSRKINWGQFGSFIKVELSKNHTNERLQKIDLSETRLIGSSISSNFYKGDKKYISLKIDTAKFYWNPFEEDSHTGEFYLDDNGFIVVEPFYSFLSPKTLFKNDGNYTLERMNDSKKFYKLGKSTFRPEYNFVSTDDRKNKIASITKEPKIQFKYKNEITEKEAFFYGDVVLKLASFFHHADIDYKFRRINLPESTITIKKIEQKILLNTVGNLWGFEIYWDFNKFLQTSWQKETVKNFALLSRVITLFNQSHIVDNSSAFLIRYNIIEICGRTSLEKGIWNFKLNNDELDNFFSEIRESISNIIEASEQEQFNNKWNSIQNIIKCKSLRKQLEDSLTKNNISLQALPIKVNQIVQLRNYITHGSLDKINSEDLRKVNILLYRICGILILNLMGIKDWKLKTEII